MLVIDNASMHHKAASEVRRTIENACPDAHLEFLPAYSPELNPVCTHSSTPNLLARVCLSRLVAVRDAGVAAGA